MGVCGLEVGLGVAVAVVVVVVDEGVGGGPVGVGHSCVAALVYVTQGGSSAGGAEVVLKVVGRGGAGGEVPVQGQGVEVGRGVGAGEGHGVSKGAVLQQKMPP